MAVSVSSEQDRAGGERVHHDRGKTLSIVCPERESAGDSGLMPFRSPSATLSHRRPEHLGQSGPDDHRDRRDGVADRPGVARRRSLNPAARGIMLTNASIFPMNVGGTIAGRPWATWHWSACRGDVLVHGHHHPRQSDRSARTLNGTPIAKQHGGLPSGFDDVGLCDGQTVQAPSRSLAGDQTGDQ